MSAPAGVADTLRGLRDTRGVARLSYFHCDHYEPWRWSADRPGISEINAEESIAFTEAMSRIPYARRLTLFMKSPIQATLAGAHKSDALPGDEIGFRSIRRRQRLILTPAFEAIARSGHELQVHLHHERFTRNNWYSTSPDRAENLPFRAFLAERSTPAMDSARFAFYLERTLALFRTASGLPLDRWMFVHGMWSLNGSDRDYCCIDDELAIMAAQGCLGDFTFPAPRAHCNPAAASPYLCRPVVAPKGYDHPDAAIEPAAGQPADGRFLIWSTATASALCSLDTTGRNFPALAADPAGWAARLLDGAVVRGDAVYLKTHAHSMMQQYFADPANPAYPHAHPAVAAMFAALMDGCAASGIAFDPITASEAYDRFVAPPAAS